jgi:alpha-beta hydrolase superfamily lysophospholipase
MTKPSILLIPGSFGLPEFYQPVIDAVAAEGYEIRGLHYPSVSLKTGPRDGIPPTMYDDAAFIATETEKLANAGKDVILLAHSYGGVPTTESTKGLSKVERQEQGKAGGIVRIAYMTAIVPAIGGSAGGMMTEIPEENKIDLKIGVSSYHSSGLQSVNPQ